MKDKNVWLGYLQAGEKSSPVALDPKLETNKANTVYLYNLKRQEFIEYSREIVEPKLRELKPKEADLGQELKAAFKKARKNFKGRGELKLANTSPATSSQPVKEAAPKKIDIDETDDDIFIGDDEWVTDE